MTSDSEQRTQLASFRFFCSFSGQLLIGAVTLSFVEHFGGTGDEINQAKGYAYTMGLFMLLATALYMYTFFATRERITLESNRAQSNDIAGDLSALFKNIGFLVLFASAIFNLTHVALRNGALLFYFDYYVAPVAGNTFVLSLLGWQIEFGKASLFFTVGSLSLLVGIIAASYMTKLFPKRLILVVCTCLVGTSLTLFSFVPPENYVAMLWLNVLASVVAGPIPVLLYTLYAEVADYTEWKTGRKVMALVYSTMLIGVKGGLVVGGSLAGYLLGLSGYVPNAEQSDEALRTIVMLVSVIPGGFALVSGVLIIFYPFTEKLMRRVETELADARLQRKNTDSQTSEQQALT